MASQLIFTANIGQFETELFATTGDGSSALRLTNFNTDENSTGVLIGGSLDGAQYVAAGSAEGTVDLWKTQVSVASTTKVATIVEDDQTAGVSDVAFASQSDSHVFLYVEGHGPEAGLWASDGTEVGTIQIPDTGGAFVSALPVAGGIVYGKSAGAFGSPRVPR